jgi:hypothetical protein
MISLPDNAKPPKGPALCDDFAVTNQGKSKPWNFRSLHHVTDSSVDLSRGVGATVKPHER